MVNQYTANSVPLGKDFASIFPEHVKYWSPKNKIEPSEVYANSTVKRFWSCDLDHEYKLTPQHKGAGVRCRVCSGKDLVPGVNDLATKIPWLAEQFDEKLNGMKASEADARNSKRYWWKCLKEKHSWDDTIGHRVNDGTSCGYCNNSRVLPGFNDIETTHPHLKQWDLPEENDKPLSAVFFGTHKKRKWRCEKGHKINQVPAYRDLGACYVCHNYGRSGPEKFFLNTLIEDWPSIKNTCWLPLVEATYTKRKKVPYDLMIEDLNLVIEYDGAYWHEKTALRDLEKGESLLKQGWNFIRLRDISLEPVPTVHPNYLEIPVNSKNLEEIVPQLKEAIRKIHDHRCG